MFNSMTVATRPWTLSAVGIILLLAGALGSARSAASTAQEPREITVLNGAGQDTIDILAFFPQTATIRAGDTITWRQNGDSTHTVSFVLGPFPGPTVSSAFGQPGTILPPGQIPVPGRPGLTQSNPPAFFPWPGPEVFGSTYSGDYFVSSGRLLGIPPAPVVEPRDTFSLTFDTPGTFPYTCLVHPTEGMAGTVVVLDASATDVPTQAEIDAIAEAEIASLSALMDRAIGQRTAAPRREPGPNNSTVSFVRAGNTQGGIADVRIQLLEFLPRDLTVQAGDTVVWGSPFFHTVTFIPAPPPPQPLTAEFQPDGSTIIIRNPEVFTPSKPAGVFDPTQYFNSAILGPGPGVAWSLTFDRPGTFEYFCAIHREAGMVGTITVVPR